MGSRSTRHHSEQDKSRGTSARANGTTMTAEHLTEREVKKLKKAELKAALEARGDREAFEQAGLLLVVWTSTS